MKKISFVQPIFAPDKLRLNRNLESLESIAKYTDKNNFDVKFHFGGWAKGDYWPTINDLINDKFKDSPFIVKKFDRNYGKAVVVNSLVDGAESEYLLTCDSDMVFQMEEENMWQRLIECANKAKELRTNPFGLVSFNQF